MPLKKIFYLPLIEEKEHRLAAIDNTLIYGFFIGYLTMFPASMVKDILSGNTLDAWIEGISALVSLLGLVYFQLRKNYDFAAYLGLAIGTASIIGLTYFQEYENHSIIYAAIFALAPFFMFSFRKGALIALVYFGIHALLIAHSAAKLHDNPLVNNPNALVNVGFTIFGVYLFGFFYHLAIRSSYEALERSNRQKEVLLQEVHHRVKNNLNIVASMLGMQAQLQDEQTRQVILRSKDRIASIALVHESIYQSSDLEAVNMQHYVTGLYDNIASLHAGYAQITVSIEMNDIVLPLQKALFLGLITNELIVNSYKHAFDPEHGGHIAIGMDAQDGLFRYRYRDDGKGVPDIENLRSYDTLGSRFILIAAEQLNARTSVQNNNGLEYEIIFS